MTDKAYHGSMKDQLEQIAPQLKKDKASQNEDAEPASPTPQAEYMRVETSAGTISVRITEEERLDFVNDLKQLREAQKAVLREKIQAERVKSIATNICVALLGVAALGGAGYAGYKKGFKIGEATD